jgi:hypothetical protein
MKRKPLAIALFREGGVTTISLSTLALWEREG